MTHLITRTTQTPLDAYSFCLEHSHQFSRSDISEKKQCLAKLKFPATRPSTDEQISQTDISLLSPPELDSSHFSDDSMYEGGSDSSDHVLHLERSSSDDENPPTITSSFEAVISMPIVAPLLADTPLLFVTPPPVVTLLPVDMFGFPVSVDIPLLSPSDLDVIMTSNSLDDML